MKRKCWELCCIDPGAALLLRQEGVVAGRDTALLQVALFPLPREHARRAGGAGQHRGEACQSQFDAACLQPLMFSCAHGHTPVQMPAVGQHEA